MEKIAEGLLSAAGRIIKSAMTVAIALVGLFAAILALMAVHGYYAVTVPTKQVTVAKFALNHKDCSDPSFPLLVSFHNQSNKTVLSINFEFNAYFRGRSTDIAEWNTLKDDKILKPGETSVACWSLPKLTDEALAQLAKSYSGKDADRRLQYANWIRTNKDKRGTAEFETVAEAYKRIRDEQTVEYKLRKLSVDFQD
jgi:hypothetical protein